jgi:hypothetical protein
MSYRPVLTSRSMIPMAAVLVVVILAISPRSLLAPALSFNQAQESKRPKTPKNIVRTTPGHSANSERAGKEPRPEPGTESLQETHDLQVRASVAAAIPGKAFQELTKPEYLRPFSGSPPGNRLAPPA